MEDEEVATRYQGPVFKNSIAGLINVRDGGRGVQQMCCSEVSVFVPFYPVGEAQRGKIEHPLGRGMRKTAPPLPGPPPRGQPAPRAPAAAAKSAASARPRPSP
eukprot:Hpha_TRINITY_DN15946_c1_g1::TRINITY_DN15946_c1_g1_i2::g.73122::m.73122